ncbi:chemotaxis protein CheB [Streptomyces sp. NPDC001941]|uniref:chemotaxis protein CheB n=1 Tax=Streptomyces sp. NPDC001941 TaxID=3154659 RepID=UPI00332FEF1F
MTAAPFRRERLRPAPTDIVAVACSAGGVRALGVLLGSLEADFAVPVLVVLHLDPRRPTLIAEILGRQCALPVKLAEQGEPARPGTVHIAPPGRHLLVGADGRLRLSGSARVHFVRPSADVLFGSVAESYGPRALVCVLTGTGRDGAAGADQVRARGGTVIVEDPRTAEFNGMPTAALGAGDADFVLPLGEISAAIRAALRADREKTEGRDG